MIDLFSQRLQAPKNPPRPHYRSWDIHVTAPCGAGYTETNVRKIDAQAAKDYLIKQGCKVSGPHGNTRAM